MGGLGEGGGRRASVGLEGGNPGSNCEAVPSRASPRSSSFIIQIRIQTFYLTTLYIRGISGSYSRIYKVWVVGLRF